MHHCISIQTSTGNSLADWVHLPMLQGIAVAKKSQQEKERKM